MANTDNVFLTLVCPILGVFIGTAMYCSPCKACWNVHKTQKLGDLNPIPFAVTFASSSTWVAYGFLSRDPFMFPQNIVGFAAAVFNSVVCFGPASFQTRNIMLLILCSTSVVMPLLGVISSFVTTHEQGIALWGYVSNTITILYYGAPLSTAVEVVRTRNSSSILIPLTATNLVNALLWTAYGFAVKDWFIVVPNLIGGFFTVILLVLRAIYPAQLPSLTNSSGHTPFQDDHEDTRHCDSPLPPVCAVVRVVSGGVKGAPELQLQQRPSAAANQLQADVGMSV